MFRVKHKIEAFILGQAQGSVCLQGQPMSDVQRREESSKHTQYFSSYHITLHVFQTPVPEGYTLQSPACVFLPKTLRRDLSLNFFESRKLLLCLVFYSKSYLLFLKQFLKHCRVHLSTEIAAVPHTKQCRSGLFKDLRLRLPRLICFSYSASIQKCFLIKPFSAVILECKYVCFGCYAILQMQ